MTSFQPARVTGALTSVARRPDVAGVSDLRLVPVTIGGHSVSMFALSPIGGGITPVSITGREPRADDEIALAPLTAQQLGAQPGQTVERQG